MIVHCRSRITNYSLCTTAYFLVILFLLLNTIMAIGVEKSHNSRITSHLHDKYVDQTLNFVFDLGNATTGEAILKEYQMLKKKSKLYENSEDTRPPYTLLRLVIQAILESPKHKLTIHGIFDYISNKYAYYRKRGKTAESPDWRNTIQYMLSQKSRATMFLREAPDDERTNPHSKGRYPGFWTYKPMFKRKFYIEAYREGKRWCC